MAIAVLCGVAQSGSRYFYCEALGLSATDPCCGPQVRHPSCPRPMASREHFDCCEQITMPSVPEGSRAIEPVVPAPGVLAVLPAILQLPEPSGSPGAAACEDGRWRGPPRAASARCAQLMVFLT